MQKETGQERNINATSGEINGDDWMLISVRKKRVYYDYRDHKPKQNHS